MKTRAKTIVWALGILVGAIIVLSVSAYLILAIFETDFHIQDKIGVIPIKGPIVSSEPIISQLVNFKKDKSIKAIILRIDSPGGGVGPSQEIYREVIKTREEKRVIASLGGIAASGAYYIASAADKIIANPGTITGSIGVVVNFLQLHELFKKLGIGFEVITSGEFKSMGSPYRRLTDKERDLIKNLVYEIKEQFIADVAKGRNLPIEDVAKIADGRIFTGSQAKRLKLLDELGNFQDAVEIAKKLVGIKKEVSLVYPPQKRFRLLDLILGRYRDRVKEIIEGTLNSPFQYRWNPIPYP